MTSRERWTVYPLLFLAIGLAMRPGEDSGLENTNRGALIFHSSVS